MSWSFWREAGMEDVASSWGVGVSSLVDRHGDSV